MNLILPQSAKRQKSHQDSTRFFIIWTADNSRWIKRAIRLGLSSIVTNDPDRLIAPPTPSRPK